jgi:hypothetical protein
MTTLSVHLPTIAIMKLEQKTSITIQLNTPLEKITLTEVQNKIFDSLTKVMVAWSVQGVHGSPEYIVLKDANDHEIIDDPNLRTSLQMSTEFSAIFKKTLAGSCRGVISK